MKTFVVVVGLAVLGGAAAANGPVGEFNVGSGPGGMGVSSQGRLYVAVDAGVAVVDLPSGELVSTLDSDSSPSEVAVDESRDRIWVLQPARHARRPGRVSVIDLHTGDTVARLETDRGPAAIALDSLHERVYVVNFYAATVQVFDSSSLDLIGTVGGSRWANGKVGHPEDVAVDAGRGISFVTTTSGYLVKLRAGKVVAKDSILDSGDDHALAIDPTRARLYVGQLDAGDILVIRTRDLRRVGRIVPRHGPWDLAVDPVLGLLGVVTTSNESAGWEVFDLESGDRIARAKLGLGGNDVVSDPGSWHFYVSDGFDDSVLVMPGEDAPPSTTSMSVSEGATLHSGDLVTGSSSDDRSGIASVTIVFENEAQTIAVQAEKSCGSSLRCDWTAVVPDAPGVYTLRSAARDVAGNLEVDPEGTMVTIVP